MIKHRLFIAIASLLIFTSASTYAHPENTQENANNGVKGVDHIGLTVSDLLASKTFFVDILGFNVLGEDTHYPAVFLSNSHITITLWQVKNTAQLVPFNRTNNVGLHHLALAVESLEKLNELYKRLAQQNNITIEFAPENMGSGPTKHMMITEPSGNRIEFITRVK
ncbi:VOC family protein [Pseudoalteromonas sp. MMG010]|uniref:VOC family protein n=1 Tax=Pseudoalteromonas sp. MMG010 TaxID=2822685 RepID=UPI001B39EF85|nr:VOC family protein [Pseudoalteromonas sp. MMG010]MBQ4833031.1 VOC family protein [Pseudoalteromonas sp. MMG010]